MSWINNEAESVKSISQLHVLISSGTSCLRWSCDYFLNSGSNLETLNSRVVLTHFLSMHNILSLAVACTTTTNDSEIV